MPTRSRNLVMLAGIAATFLVQYLGVRSTNFGGFDEWLYISLTSRGILAFPHSNRPLTLLWSLPAAVLTPHTVWGYHLLHGLYLGLGGLTVFALCRRLSPPDPLLAFLAGVFTTVWAPLDHNRLETLLATMNSGTMLTTLVSLLLLVESWRRGRPSWLALSALALAELLALVTARGYEAMLPFLIGAPITMYACRPERSRRLLLWVALWEAVMAWALWRALTPLLRPSAEVYYQTGLGLDTSLGPSLLRLLRQFSFHLAPLARPIPELRGREALLAGLVFAGAWWLVARGAEVAGREARQRHALVLAIGALWAGLAYAPFALSSSPLSAGPERTQFLSSAGIALVLACVFHLACGRLPARWRAAGLGLLGAWVVVLGTARTVALQAEWDRHSVYRAQNGSLQELTRQAPGLEPLTLVLFLDEGGAFPASFTFRHAIEYLYPGQATGYVWNARDHDLFYATAFTPEGILSEPWTIIREAWHAPPRLYRYDEVLVVRHTRDGRVAVVGDWPRALPPLPPGAIYAPRSRIRPEADAPAERAILR